LQVDYDWLGDVRVQTSRLQNRVRTDVIWHTPSGIHQFLISQSLSLSLSVLICRSLASHVVPSYR